MSFNKSFAVTSLAVAMTASALVGCTDQYGNPIVSPNATGTLLGGAAGGFLGSQFGEGSGKTVAAIGGALLGAWAGNAIANGMTAQDRGYYNSAAQQAASAPVGQTVTWYNPTSGAQGTITPTRTGTASDGSACREYQQTVTIGGRTERAYGTACQQADGSWRIVN